MYGLLGATSPLRSQPLQDLGGLLAGVSSDQPSFSIVLPQRGHNPALLIAILVRAEEQPSERGPGRRTSFGKAHSSQNLHAGV